MEGRREGHGGRQEGGTWRETGGREMEGRREGGERGMDVGHGDKNQRGGANKLKQNKHLDD